MFTLEHVQFKINAVLKHQKLVKNLGHTFKEILNKFNLQIQRFTEYSELKGTCKDHQAQVSTSP